MRHLNLKRLVTIEELRWAVKADKNYFICQDCEVSWAGKSACWSCGTDCIKTKRKFVSSLHYDIHMMANSPD